jgi:hypothetical protein
VDIERETTMTQEDIDLFLESVDTGYTRCNVQPMCGDYMRYSGPVACPTVYGCGITAALINKNGLSAFQNMSNYPADVVSKEFNLSMDFITGFIAGFDSLARRLPYVHDYCLGYDYGQQKFKKWINKENT